MKKLLMFIVALVAVNGLFAFEARGVLFGGISELTVRKHATEDKWVSTVIFYPQFGAFVSDNVTFDVVFGVNSIIPTAVGLGMGSRYFYKNCYAGVDFAIMRGFVDGYLHVTPKLGYLVPIVPNAYADVQAYYRRSIARQRYKGSDYAAIRVGLQVNFDRKRSSKQDQ